MIKLVIMVLLEDPSKQPVEVWVRSGGLVFQLGKKTRGEKKPYLSILSPEGFPVPLPNTAHCQAANSVGAFNLDIFKCSRPCLDLALFKKRTYYYVFPGFIAYDARACL